ncbi:hypothetical protein C8Q75DRAFT_557234 [Abortiporus biennis]|nr:hypothetical protein C8Q75DRAFT_557234 [Abortiporus biennis]
MTCFLFLFLTRTSSNCSTSTTNFPLPHTTDTHPTSCTRNVIDAGSQTTPIFTFLREPRLLFFFSLLSSYGLSPESHILLFCRFEDIVPSTVLIFV